MSSHSAARPLFPPTFSERALSYLLLPPGVLAGLFILAVFIWSLTVPYLGVDIAFHEGGWRVNQLDENGTAHRDGIGPGDAVVRVNGLAPEDVARGLTYIGAFHAQSLQVLDPSGRVVESSAHAGPVPADAIVQAFGVFTVGAAFWLTGFLSFLRKPGSRPVLFLYLVGLSVAIAAVSGMGSMRGWIVARHLEVAGLLLSPWLVVRLFLAFPSERRIKLLGKDISLVVHVPPALLLLIYAVVGHQDWALYVWFRPLIVLNLGVGFLVAIGIVAHSYFSASYARSRQQMKILAFGVGASALPLLALGVIPEMMGQGALVRSEILIMAFVALPVSLGHVIIRHELFDIDRAISRVIWYGLLSCVFIAGYVLFSWLVTATLPALGLGWQLLLLMAVTMVALALSRPARQRVREMIAERLDAGRYDYKQAATGVIADLASQSELEGVTRLLAESMARFFRLEGACLLLNVEDAGMVVSAAYGVYADSPAKQERLLELCPNLGEDHLFPNKAPPESGAALLVPLVTGKKRVGTLALSGKVSRADFGVDDIYFLFSIKAQGSLAVHNALLLKDAQARATELEEAYEAQKENNDYLGRSTQALHETYMGTMRTLVLALESRSPYTKGHSDRVTQLSRRTATQLGLGPAALLALQMAAQIHDIGKIAIPESILLKAGPLEHNERAEIELHPVKGVEMLRFLGFARPALPIIEAHHERVDGRGYPHGLRGDQIPLAARIIAVADAYDAMTSERPYRKACSSQEAIQQLREGAGAQWDPKVVTALERLPALGAEDT